MYHCIACLFLFLTLSTAAFANEFTLAFDWGDIPLCNNGQPNKVPNPSFVVFGVPKGTRAIQFVLTDLDVPTYDHGGGTVAYEGQEAIDPGAFHYKSPCPSDGTHRYEWKAIAVSKSGFFSKTLGKASAMEKYPKPKVASIQVQHFNQQ